MRYDHYHFNQTMTDSMFNTLEKDPEYTLVSGTTHYRYHTPRYAGDRLVWHVPSFWSPGYYSYATTQHTLTEDDPDPSIMIDGDPGEYPVSAGKGGGPGGCGAFPGLAGTLGTWNEIEDSPTFVFSKRILDPERVVRADGYGIGGLVPETFRLPVQRKSAVFESADPKRSPNAETERTAFFASGESYDDPAVTVEAAAEISSAAAPYLSPDEENAGIFETVSAAPDGSVGPSVSVTNGIFLVGVGDISVGASAEAPYVLSGAAGQYYVGVFYDAEKGTRSGDRDLCWAATVSNMLTYTGWGLINGNTTEDDVLDDFRPYFSTGGTINEGVKWYFTGRYDGFFNGGGGFYTTLNPSEYMYNYYTYSGLSSKNFANILSQYLSAGYACGVAMGWYTSPGAWTRHGGHAVTVWGYTYDSSYSVSDPRYLTGLIVSDSDDNKTYTNPRSAPDKYKIITLSYNSALDAYYTVNYKSGSLVGEIEGFTFLQQTGNNRGPADLIFANQTSWGRNYSIATSINGFSASLPALTSDNTVYIAVNVKNDGFTDTSATTLKYTLTSTYNGVLQIDKEGSISISALKSQASSLYAINLGKLAARGYTLTLRLDPNGLVEESSEANNSREISFAVGYGANYIQKGGAYNNQTLRNSTVFLMSGASAAGNTLSSGGYLVASSGAVVSRNAVYGSGCLTIERGGIASSNYLHDGSETVGGTAFRTIVSGETVACAGQTILSGGIAISSYLEGSVKGAGTDYFVIDIPRGFQVISSGGTASSTFAAYRGSQIVKGLAVDTYLSGGRQDIAAGGVAVGTVVSDGRIDIKSDGVLRGAVFHGGWMKISSGGAAYDTLVENCNAVIISNGGVLSNTVIQKGFTSAMAGAIVRDLTLSGGTLNVGFYEASPDIYDITVGTGATMKCGDVTYFHGTLDVAGTLVVNYAYKEASLIGLSTDNVENGAPRINIDLEGRKPGEGAAVTYSGFSEYYTVTNEYMDDRFSDNIAFSITLGQDTRSGNYSLMTHVSSINKTFSVYDSSKEYLGTVSADGSLTYGSRVYSLVMQGQDMMFQVYDPAVEVRDAVKVISASKVISAGNYLSGQVISRTDTMHPMSMTVDEQGVADETTLGDYGVQYIHPGGVAKNTTMVSQSHASQFVSGVASGTIVDKYCHQYIDASGVAIDTTLIGGGWQYIHNGGIASNTVVSSGYVDVSSGGLLRDAVFSGGYLTICSSGSARGIHLGKKGYLTISGGEVENIKLYADSNGFNIHSSACLRGDIIIGSGGHIWLARDCVAVDASKATICFDLATRSVNSAFLSASSGDVIAKIGSTSYSVRVSSDIAYGQYKLAENINSMPYSITVVSTTGRSLGSISVGGSPLLADNAEYSLVKENSVLSLLVKEHKDGGTPGGTTYNIEGNQASLDTISLPATITGDLSSSLYFYDSISFRAGFSGECTISMAAELLFGQSHSVKATLKNSDQETLADIGTGRSSTIRLTGGAMYYLQVAMLSPSYMTTTNYSYAVTIASGSVASAKPAGNDLNGDGRADVVMSITESGHGAEGATGAWLIQNDQTAAWGDLSLRNPGWEIFGMGVTTAGKTTDDVYVRSSDNVIGAWVTDDSGHVAGWATVGQFDGNTRILGLGDFNGDGQSDLLLRNTNGAVGCYFTSGEKTGWNYFQSLGNEWRIAAVGDFNGDGRDDVVLSHNAGFAGTWLTQADGTMAWADLDAVSDGFVIAGAGDFDGDGVDDVLLQNGTYCGAWLAENGSAKAWFGLGDLGNVTVEQIADFDGDGKDDLRIRTAAGDIGALLVRGEGNLAWRYYGSVDKEWGTSLAAL